MITTKKNGCKPGEIKFNDECLDKMLSSNALDIKLTGKKGKHMMTLTSKNKYGEYLIEQLKGREKDFVKFMKKELPKYGKISGKTKKR